MNPIPNPVPTFEQLDAMKDRLEDAKAVAKCLSYLAKTDDPWNYVSLNGELDGCALKFDPINSDLSILIIERGQERCVIHRMPSADPKIPQADFSVLAQSRLLRAKGIQGIIEHWYTFVGAEELLRQAANRVPYDTLTAPDVFQGHFPMLYDAATGGGI